jgi:CBS-domain-containing membrane protein
MDRKREKHNHSVEADISDSDIYEAMMDVQGYLDITPADLKEIYRAAFRHALARIKRSVTAREIMTREVVSVQRTAAAIEVAELMAEHLISGIPVIETDGTPAGMISEKDFLPLLGARDRRHFMAAILNCLRNRGCVSKPVLSQKAEEIMTAPAFTVGEDSTAWEIAALFSEKDINRVPVVDEKGRLTGIVSRTDLVRAMLRKER